MGLCWKRSFKQILKRALFFAVYYSGVLHLLIFILKKFKKRHCASILLYHRFSQDLLDGYQLPHLAIREFKEQMRHIKKWYSVISMDELEGSLANENDFTSPSAAITFDDGFLSNYTLAYPILKEFGLPAMIYLSTGFIGTNNAPWVDELMDILSTTKSSTLSFPELLGDEVLDISTRRQKREAVTILFNIMLRLEHKQKIMAMQNLSKILRVNVAKRNIAERKMLNWDEVKEMSENSISFGAHTISHPTLSKMELSEAKREIYESKKEIEARIGKKVMHFAIPNGKKEDFSEKLKEYCKEIGLKTVVSTEPGLVDGKSDPYFLRRIIPPPPMYVFACELARYMFFKKIS